MPLYFWRSQRLAHYFIFTSVGRHFDPGAQLAVDLDGQRQHLIDNQCWIVLRPRLLMHTERSTQLLPQFFGQEGRERRENQHVEARDFLMSRCG